MGRYSPLLRGISALLRRGSRLDNASSPCATALCGPPTRTRRSGRCDLGKGGIGGADVEFPKTVQQWDVGISASVGNV
jgi:hypothetical protein